MSILDVLSLFLYFPEDKSEYLPAAITSMIFLIAAILTMRFFILHSRKEQAKAKELEEKLKNEE
jgi:preprotein translocase subunit YajC